MTDASRNSIVQLAKTACAAYDGQFTAFFMAMDRGFDQAEVLHQDVTGEPLFGSDRRPGLGDREMGTLSVAFDMIDYGSPEVPEQRRSQAALQLAAEDELGRLVAQDVPSYVRRALGPPPAPQRAGQAGRPDPRWWVKNLDLDQELSKQCAWERTAGAYVALVEGRCGGDVRLVRSTEQQAQQSQDTMAGRVVTQHFSDVERCLERLAGPLDA